MTDLISQIEDPRLRERLSQEWAAATKEKKFGLVFDPHLPELLPLPGARLRRGDLAAPKGGVLTDLWRVRRIRDGIATCARPNGAADLWEFPVDDLTVVRQFGEPIFPALVPMGSVQNGPADAPYHVLIEADNFHALQALDYLYAGQVDCIYIDPPYNTGARDWKYNNDYVDGNDSWRHSKWLAFMERRLRLAKRLLRPDTGVLIVTIDEHEVHHLGMLLNELFPDAYRQMVSIVVNPKGVTQGRFSRVEEYALFCFMKDAFVKGIEDDLLSPIDERSNGNTKPRWKGLLRSGTNARRIDRDKMFFPVLIDEGNQAVVGAGDYLPLPDLPDLGARPNGYARAWPIRTDGSFGNWGVSPPTLRQLIAKGYVSLGRYDEKRRTWGISYLSTKLQRQIETGAIQIVSFDKQRNIVAVEYAEARERQIKTIWHRSSHDAGAYGSDVLKAVLGITGSFSFPKSLYATRDAITAVTRDRPNAIVVDFFAGSGTTLNAVNLLNAMDGGQRRCILVTNNEVSGEDSQLLRDRGLHPGDDEWEQLGICRAVTWPRSKFTILGRRDDGTPLPGEYLSGKRVERERARRFLQISFIDPATLDTPAMKRQLVALIDGLPQTLVTDPCPFIVSGNHAATVLFDDSAAEEWLAALDGQDQIRNLYILTSSKSRFDILKAEAAEILGPVVVAEEERRPLAAGFPANLAYFRLDIDRQFDEAGRRLGDGLHKLYWIGQGDRDALEVKVEVIVLAGDTATMKRLEAQAETAFDHLYDGFKAKIGVLPEGRRQRYERLRLATAKPVEIPWNLPDTIDFRRTAEAPLYARHLYLEPDGQFRADLGPWEAGVLQEELGNPTVVAWLRNLDRKPWSLEIPYDHGGEIRPMFPDLLIARQAVEDEGFRFDILEPHDPSLGDNVEKAVGLARFAERHGHQYDRIQLIRRQHSPAGGQAFYRLEINRTAMQKKLLLVTTNPQLDALFAAEAVNIST